MKTREEKEYIEIKEYVNEKMPKLIRWTKKQ
jgi:hypothetical protein